MRHVVDTDEVAHLWAHQTQDDARNKQGNFYFRGDTIYSYGSHFPIARHVTNRRGHRAVLVTTRQYSNTTTGHIWSVKRACSHLTRFDVKHPTWTPSQISAAYGKEFHSQVEALKPYLAPPPKYPRLRKATLEYEVRSYRYDPEPCTKMRAETLCGKRLGMYRDGGVWHVTLLKPLIGVQPNVSRVVARELIARLDHLRAWDLVPPDGKLDGEAFRDTRDRLYDHLRNARTHAERLDINRHPSSIAKLMGELENTISSANQFNEFFGFRRRFRMPEALQSLWRIADEYRSKREEGRAERRARRASANQAEYDARMAERALQDAELVAKWRAGERVYRDLHHLPTMLRVRGEEVETSLGAKFPVEHAKRGVLFVRAVVAKGEPYVHNGHSFHLGHYTIDRIDPDGTVHAGCHHVAFSEIERIAADLGVTA